MPARNRERSRENAIPGQYVFGPQNGAILDGPYPGFSGSSWTETCADSTQPYPFVNDQSFLLVSKRAGGMKLNGFYHLFSGYGYTYSNYSVTNRSGYQYCPSQSDFNSAFWVTKALANMNPSKPLVDLPLFLFELKDFPRMLKDLGRVLQGRAKPVDVPNGHLAYVFGWAPLVSDLLKLLKLQQSIEERKRYLQRLERGTRLKRILFQGEVSRVRQVDGYTISGVTADVELIEHLKVWFTANAKLQIPLTNADLEEDRLIRLLLGATPAASTLWNAVPWSWLVDYFVNVGDTLEAQRGWIPFSTTRMCVMGHSIIQSNLTRMRVTEPTLSVSDSGMITEVKRRTVVANPMPWLTYDPFLSTSQMAILTSLVVSRVMGGGSISR